jgi:hypothetical protein
MLFLQNLFGFLSLFLLNLQLLCHFLILHFLLLQLWIQFFQVLLQPCHLFFSFLHSSITHLIFMQFSFYILLSDIQEMEKLFQHVQKSGGGNMGCMLKLTSILIFCY